MALIGIWAVAATAAWLLTAWKSHATCRSLDALLAKIIEGEKIGEIPLQEGGLSLLSQHLKEVSEKLSFEIKRADQEKEQVKQLISNMSHQLKTPLANLAMYEELLTQDGLTPQQKAAFLGKLQAQTEKLDWLLHSLFQMTRLEQNVIDFETEEAGIKKTIQHALGAVFGKAEKKGVLLRVIPFPDTPLLHNPKWTAEVFTNLLENAVKYTPQSGWVEISLERLETYSIIHVKDSGIGIPPEDLPHIFERFYRGGNAEAYEGSGIGLCLSKIILEKEKGYITVQSAPGAGSDFSVFLQNC